MKWSFERAAWHRHGQCWSRAKITKHVFYYGNQVLWSWGRIALIFERREWIYPNSEGVRK